MATAERPSALDGNEGHIGDIVLIGAIDSVLQEAGSPLSTREIASRLGQQGFPAGDAGALQTDVEDVLLTHPDAFVRNTSGWAIRPMLDPRGGRTRQTRTRPR